MSFSPASVDALLMAHSSYEGQRYRHMTPEMATHVHVGQALQEPHSRRTNLAMNARSPPTSQASSRNDSLGSEISQIGPSVASDLDHIRPHGVMTPSHVFLNNSSQEGEDRNSLVELDASTVDQDEDVDGPVVEDTQDKDPTSAPKRMANGEIKPAESSQPTSPVEYSEYRHSRNSSRTSRGSQIGEVRHLSQCD